MSGFTPLLFAYVFTAVFLAGIVRGATGFGFSMIMIVLLTLFFPPAQVAPVILFWEVLASIGHLPFVYKQVHWKSLRWLALGVALGTPFGVYCLVSIPVDAMRLIINAVVLILTSMLYCGLRPKNAPTPPQTTGVGLLAGVINGASANGGPPIILFFLAAQVIVLRLDRRQLLRIGIGLVYTYVGLVLFLTGVNVGFLPAGRQLGQALGSSAYSWSLIPLGALLGWFIVEAEPAVHVLCVQVESVTGGAVSKNAMGRALSIGMAVSVALAMARILFGIPLYAVILPGYVLAMGLSFAVPPMFTGIAFDSGGVASGPMTAAFLLPFAMGACEALGGSILLDAFGVVALVAMTPLITIQLMGLSYRRKLRRHAAVLEEGTDEILEYDVSMYQTQEVKELG